MCGAQYWPDRRLIVSKLKIYIQPKRRPQGVKAHKLLNINRLREDTVNQSLASTLEKRLETLDNLNVEASWGTLRDFVYSTAMECLGPT